MLTLVLGIALVDGSFVLTGGVPHLTSKGCPTISAEQSSCKDVTGLPFLFQLIQFNLNQIKDVTLDNGFMVILHIILWEFPFIRFGAFRQEIRCETFLKEGIALIFFISKHTLDRAIAPLPFPLWRWNPLGSQLPCNFVGVVSQ